MARKTIDIGTVGNDGTGDSIRDSFRKVNDNFRELYSSLGLGERLRFTGLEDAPSTYVGQNDPATGNTPVLTVNNTESGLAFKALIAGNGISLDFTANPNQIGINADFAEISADETPQLGGDLSLRSGGNQFRVIDAGTDISPLDPIYPHELVNKAYADSKLARAGVNTIDPSTGQVNGSFGTMTGPLILARNPEPDDDALYGGRIAATKAYVDSAGFASKTNLYVALSGQDDNPSVTPELQGRSLATAYRTLEAALKRAEELVLDSKPVIGPYEKTLTFNNGTQECSLSAIEESPLSGVGFQGRVRMSVDTVTLASVGTNYYVGDVLQLNGGTVPVGGGACLIQVLTTTTTPGSIVTFKIISSGTYEESVPLLVPALPGSTSVGVTIVTSAAPGGVGAIGVGATFNVTYRVASVVIINAGTGYSLVSVRIDGGGGTGAFGQAVVTAGTGAIASITITDKGSDFTSLPTLLVTLPRFLIFTNALRTDFTGDVTTNTVAAVSGRDIREGLFLKGKTSLALAQILEHSGALDTAGNEIFDVDILYGQFQIGEPITYGDVAFDIQISVLVESGEYRENYPLKVPANVSIVGDEFRRVIFRPMPGTSSSPYAFQRFRRDLVTDGLQTATQLYGYHYLQDSSAPVYPKIQNPGAFTAAADLIRQNRKFIQEELTARVRFNITNAVAPFNDPAFASTYDNNFYKSSLGQIIDAVVFDLKFGEYNRTISAALKFYQTPAGLILINQHLAQFVTNAVSVINQLETFLQQIIDNTVITALKQLTFTQTIDAAFQSELGSDAVITDLFLALKDVLDGSGSVNYPKDNEEMDVFLANDTVRWQAISAIGHGGFMAVLDPQGQILAKSPYFQECASFSRSKDRQVFAGGMFIDGFAGNLEYNLDAVISPTRLQVSGLDRVPQLPASFIDEGVVYRVNFLRDFVYNANGSSAVFELDQTTPWPFVLFTYNSAVFSQVKGFILDNLGRDLVLQTNYWTRQSGIFYRLSQNAFVLLDQRTITKEAIKFVHDSVNALLPGTPNIVVRSTVDQSNNVIADIIDRGIGAAAFLQFTLPTSATVNQGYAYALLLANRDYALAELLGFINDQISTSTAPFASGDQYQQASLEFQIRQATEAVIHDVIYGGNSATRTRGLYFWNYITGAAIIDSALTPTKTAAWHIYLAYLLGQVAQNLAPATSYSPLARTTGTAASATEASIINSLLTDVSNIISAANFTAAQAVVAITEPSFLGYTANNTAARTTIQTNRAALQAAAVAFVDFNGNRYELLAPGNRSMLANDYTQINDMGYGIIVANGGLSELVGVFTYYCYASYYSLTGGQIRSVGGSSAHGVYALVAEGADPLEVPTPTTLYEELNQGVTCFFPSSQFENIANGLVIFVTDFEYPPLGQSELEILHGNDIVRYPVTSAATTDLPAGVARLNLAKSDGVAVATEGLAAVVAAGTRMTLRMNGKILLTGRLEDVAVRPSTGLKLRETPGTVYRVLQFDAANDANGPYEILTNLATPNIFRVVITVVTITGNTVLTTSSNHKLKIGDRFIPTSTANGLTSGVSLFIVSVPLPTQFTIATSPGAAALTTLTDGAGLTIKGVKSHKLIENYEVDFSTTGTLPAPLLGTDVYFVVPNNLTETEFSIALIKNGPPIGITTAGTGTHSYNIDGLTETSLRENYDYLDITVLSPGDFVSATPTGLVCTITIAAPAVVTLVAHGFVVDAAIKFTVSLGGALPTGMAPTQRYFVIAAGLGVDDFQFSDERGGTAIETTGTGGGTIRVGLVTGRVGDDTFAVVPVAPTDISRLTAAKFVFIGEEYVISGYQSETVTTEPFGRLILNRPLVHAVNQFSGGYTIKAAVSIRTNGSLGTLTIRIALTRVTGHDLLEIGTGSYADTNYPSEIYGPPVLSLQPGDETDERDVGRVFFVTTDQFGNFSVGPFFKVDQGTGTVQISSAIALSNLDGIGFKRGVPIAEFSTDSSFSDNATDTVPTENAARTYIERRLGLTHGGSVVVASSLIPIFTGGYMALDGQLSMNSNMNLGINRIVNLADPQAGTDAVNLQSLTVDNLQDLTVTNVEAGQTLVFTGAGNSLINATLTGDISFELQPGIDSALNTVNAQLNPGVVANAEVNAAAAIAQSKLAMTVATAQAAAPVGSAAAIQAASGLSSFSSLDFDVTSGHVAIKANSVQFDDIQQMPPDTVIGNSALVTANAAAVTFATVIDEGLAVKKSQFNSLGFLRRTGAGFAGDGDYTVVQGSAGTSAVVAAGEIIVRSIAGDFGGNVLDVNQIKVDNNLAVDTVSTTLNDGYIRYYGYGSQGGILIQTGSLGTDRKTAYWNDAHEFKTQSGVSNAPITCSTVTATSVSAQALTTGGNAVAGTITGRWTLTGDPGNESRLQATYSADLAENYEGDKLYEVGTVLVFGGDKEVTITNIKGDTRVAGVVSNTAAYTMFEACPGLKNLVALQGRVPCRVVGKIVKGDLLITAGIPGVAVAARDVRVGTVVGKALVAYDSDHIGTIEIAVGRT